ncbi:pollen-specific leucine-rich repeat extensin-like protein 4 isoform X2 [Coffea eugenioides]|uniref:pollen-specific leucine-rich repeat extensin-like protein 4 isoform X2 n=1 Tax=Coffea eugenioides TaxID=49369 RepID=UPI000F5D222B|nr:pollen-specific leucine-rich repeat extensin-like protein 4 isoform X2 [Coffea arabica]XP_027156926.1 pollen-specific leucine-rich repeat extensin-like protein 4 isoform X2 [Coffea eugenioides]
MKAMTVLAMQIRFLSIFVVCTCCFLSQSGSIPQISESKNSQVPARPLFDLMLKKAKRPRGNIFLQDSTLTVQPNDNFPPYCTLSPLIPKSPISTAPTPGIYTPLSLPSPMYYAPPFTMQSPPPTASTPRIVPTPPCAPPSPPTPQRPQFSVWCVAKPTVPPTLLQVALDYACGSGADCEPIKRNGLCYLPDTVIAHASYAFNSYWQKTKLAGGTCDFGGTAMLVSVDPSYDECQFIYS